MRARIPRSPAEHQRDKIRIVATELDLTPPKIAFKEWASVVLALESGSQDLIFRKGGIAEEGRGFEVEHTRFLLFPTYFHQQTTGLRDEFASLLERAMQARPPEGQLVITSWVEVTRSFAIEREADLLPLMSRHVYAPHVLQDRLLGRYGKTLHALEVKTHILGRPLTLPLLEAHAGCKSWVDLDAT
jgi:hypothetical protein